MSGHAAGLEVDLDAALDPSSSGDAGVPMGAALLHYANAVHDASAVLDGTREVVRSTLGTEATYEAAATIAIFNGLVRVADGTGIQLDDGVVAESADYRDRLGVNEFAGAANTSVADGPARERVEIETIRDLY